VQRAATARTPLAGVVVGRPREYFPDGLDAGVRERCDVALAALVTLGATVRDVSLPHTAYAIPVYYIVAPAEASSNLARFDGVRYGARVPADALTAILASARVRDTLTLWHLLPRVAAADRERVYDRIAALTPVPNGISKEKVLNLDSATLSHWKDELAWTW